MCVSCDATGNLSFFFSVRDSHLCGSRSQKTNYVSEKTQSIYISVCKSGTFLRWSFVEVRDLSPQLLFSKKKLKTLFYTRQIKDIIHPSCSTEKPLQKVDDRYNIHLLSQPSFVTKVRGSSRVVGASVCIPGLLLCCLSGQTVCVFCESWRRVTSAFSSEGQQVIWCGGGKGLSQGRG